MGNNIYYLCPDVQQPAGGIKVIYQHVDMLRRNGLNAFVAHIAEGFRCAWFKNDVPIRAVNSLRFTPDDFLVIPAVWGLKLKDFAPGIRKILINQGAYLTFRGYPVTGGAFDTPYRNPDVRAVITVSEDNQRYIQYVFPHLKVCRVRNYIDSDVFAFTATKLKQIAFMTRKRYEDIEQVINILRYRGALDSFALAPIDGKSEHEVAAILRENFPSHTGKIPKGVMPDWLLGLAAVFNPPLKQVLPELGRERQVSNEKARRVLGWTPRPAETAVIEGARSLIDLKVV